LVFACNEKEFGEELLEDLSLCEFRYKVIIFDIKMPQWGRDRIWGITQAREEIRRYAVQKNSDYLIFLDCDMIYGENLINDLVSTAGTGKDVVYNGYLLKNGKVTFNGFGGTLIAKKIFSSVHFRCYEAKNKNAVVDEGLYFELDSINANSRISRGIFAESCHYLNNKEFQQILPRRLTSGEKSKFSPLCRKMIALFSNKPKILLIVSTIGLKLMKYG